MQVQVTGGEITVGISYHKKTFRGCRNDKERRLTRSYNHLCKMFVFRLTVACQKKCISPKYKEGDLTKGESVCLDRCVAKYLEIHDRIGKKLTAMSMQDEKLMSQLQGQAQTGGK